MIFLKPDFENSILSSGEFDLIVGIDEVGRGCLAGPVSVCGYGYSLQSSFIEGVNDSKKLSAKNRNYIYEALSSKHYIYLERDSLFIDKFGIALAIESMIEEIVEKFFGNKVLFLIDGQFKKDFGVNTKKVVKGDSKHYSIALASIVAKVKRDKLMVEEFSKKYSGYDFENNVGYGTGKHIKAINEKGLSPIHRTSFKLHEK